MPHRAPDSSPPSHTHTPTARAIAYLEGYHNIAYGYPAPTPLINYATVGSCLQGCKYFANFLPPFCLFSAIHHRVKCDVESDRNDTGSFVFPPPTPFCIIRILQYWNIFYNIIIISSFSI